MPDGWRIHIAQNAVALVVVEGPTFSLKDGVAVLNGDADLLVLKAGYTGNLYYFAGRQSFGIPVKLMDCPGRPTFYWMFPDIPSVADGIACRASDLDKEPVARMSIAEFVTCGMMMNLEAAYHEDPTLGDWAIVPFLARLLADFEESVAARPPVLRRLHHLYGYELDEDSGLRMPYLEGAVATFMDGSQMRMDGSGYNVMLESTQRVRIPAGKAGKMPDVRTVQIQPASGEMNYWVQ